VPIGDILPIPSYAGGDHFGGTYAPAQEPSTASIAEVASRAEIEFGYNIRQEFQLESKKDMKGRGLASLDKVDAPALSFAYFAYDVSASLGRGSHERKRGAGDFGRFRRDGRLRGLAGA